MSPCTVEIRGPSDRGELQLVIRACALVAIGGLLVIARTGPAGVAASDVAPYQVRFGELAPAEQRIARALREGLTEAEGVRARTGNWPTVDALAGDGVPPFAVDPLAPGMHWALTREGSTLNYLGLTPGGASYLLVIQEPEPGSADPADTPPDEVHHKLRDGTIIHVYACVRDGAPPSTALTAKPWLEGWKQIVADAPPPR